MNSFMESTNHFHWKGFDSSLDESSSMRREGSFVFDQKRTTTTTFVQVFVMRPYVLDGLTVLFPFEAYQCQIDYMKAVIECLVKVGTKAILQLECLFFSGSKWDSRKSNG